MYSPLSSTLLSVEHNGDIDNNNFIIIFVVVGNNSN